MTATIPHWIDGKPFVGDHYTTSPIHNPATGEVIAELAHATPEEVERIIASSAAAFETWSQVSLGKRSAILFRFRELLVEHTDELAATVIDVFSFRQPVGVVAGITPFNFPVMIPLWMSPVAIATGNTFILKPPGRDPGAGMFIAELWKKAGLPDGVFNVVHGDRQAGLLPQLGDEHASTRVTSRR